jgi:hypothetical protein
MANEKRVRLAKDDGIVVVIVYLYVPMRKLKLEGLYWR